MIIKKAEYIISGTKASHIPNMKVPEFVFMGRSNVGKSSLLNALLNYEQAIVTDIEGTTRDVVSGSIEYKGFIFNFYDTMKKIHNDR